MNCESYASNHKVFLCQVFNGIVGFLSAKKITTYIFGKDSTGKVVYREEFSNMGFITSQYVTIDERIIYLDKKYPNLQWEYESWKD